jgi:methionyl-tRNA synthetase
VPEGGSYGPRETALIADLQNRLETYQTHMEAVEVRKSAAELRAIWALGNEYLQAAEPWAVYKTNPEEAAGIIRLSLNLIALYGQLSTPFIPDAAHTLRQAMGQTDPLWPEDLTQALTSCAAGDAFTVPENLFAKITDEQRDEWAIRFSGIRQ